MKLELFINFAGNCREAATFYAKVFRSEVHNLMTYNDAPADLSHPVQETDRERIMYAGIPVGDMVVMLTDLPSDSPLTVGDNITPTVSTADKDEVIRLFEELKEGGEIYMELQKTFYSELYGMVKDQFGVIWHLLYHAPQKIAGMS